VELRPVGAGAGRRRVLTAEVGGLWEGSLWGVGEERALSVRTRGRVEEGGEGDVALG